MQLNERTFEQSLTKFSLNQLSLLNRRKKTSQAKTAEKPGEHKSPLTTKKFTARVLLVGNIDISVVGVPRTLPLSISVTLGRRKRKSYIRLDFPSLVLLFLFIFAQAPSLGLK